MSGESPSARQPGWQGSPGQTPHGTFKPAPSRRSIVGSLVLAIVVGTVVIYLVYAYASQGTDGQPKGAAEVKVLAPADLCWSGAFGDRTVEGCGSASVALEDTSGVYSANAQKQDDSAGELTLILMVGNQEVDHTSTSAAYGLASVVGQR